MFTRPRFSHPYKANPAGFRIADYLIHKPCFSLFAGLNSRPAQTTSNDPTNDLHPHENDAPPTIRLADFFASAAPDHNRNMTPNVDRAHIPARNPPPNLPRRKARHVPKRPSFAKTGHIRPDALPPHRRAEQLKEKRNVARKRAFQRRAAALGSFANLTRDAQALMEPEYMDQQDRIFLKQLRKLRLDDEFELGVERFRQQLLRAAHGTKERVRAQKMRDKEAEKLREETRDEDPKEEQSRLVAKFLQAKEEAAMRADKERQRDHDSMERKIREDQERFFRREQERKLKEEAEHRRREEQQRRLEEAERRRQEEQRRRIKEEWERRVLQQERERRIQEEVERLRREARERFLREETERRQRQERQEAERRLREEVERLRKMAQERAEQERFAREEQARRAFVEEARRATLEEQLRQHFARYEAKWNELRTSNSIPPISVQEMPWPVFCTVSSVDQITYEDVRSFLFHPQRPGIEGKTAKDKVKSELLRFHPDKFGASVVPKFQPAQIEIAKEIAGAVVRILTRMLAETGK